MGTLPQWLDADVQKFAAAVTSVILPKDLASGVENQEKNDDYMTSQALQKLRYVPSPSVTAGVIASPVSGSESSSGKLDSLPVNDRSTVPESLLPIPKSTDVGSVKKGILSKEEGEYLLIGVVGLVAIGAFMALVK